MMFPQLLAASLVSLCFTSIAGASSPAVDPNLPLLRQLLEVPEADLDLARAKLQIDQLVDPSIDAAGSLQKIEAIVSSVKARLPPSASSNAKLEALRAQIYQAGPWNGSQPFRYDLEDPMGRDLRNKMLPVYLSTRKGNCVSMPILFVVLGQKLGLDVSLATAPEHLLVKYRDEQGRVTNVEATSGGYKLDSSYQRDLPMTSGALANGVYMRALSKRESVAAMASTLMEYYSQSRPPEQGLALADLILEFYPKNTEAMLHKGYAYSRMIKRDFMSKYATPAQIPPAELPRFAMLRQQNELWYSKAEALGWRQPGRAQQVNYMNTVKRAKEAAQQGGK